MNNVYLDIETIPNQSPEYAAKVREGIKPPASYKKPETIAQWMVDNGQAAAQEQIDKTSFDPAYGHICTIGFAIDEGEIVALHAETVEGERLIIETFFAALPTLGQNRIIGHYVTGFDLRFIVCRAVALGVKLPHKVLFPRDPKPWDDCVFDTMTAWAGARGTVSQKVLCEALGIAGKPPGLDGSQIAKAWADGRHSDIAAYCKGDVRIVREIHRRFEQVEY